MPPAKVFSKYFAFFENDPLNKSVGLKSVNPLVWKHFGPLSSSYEEFLEEPSNASLKIPGGNTKIVDIGFDFPFNGTTYNKFIASPHGWIALLDPDNLPNANLDKVYDGRFLINGSSSFDNSAIREIFSYNDVLLAPWFDRLMMTHQNLDSFVTFFSETNPALLEQKDNFLYGKIDSKDQPFNSIDYAMAYANVEDSVDGKALVIRWNSMGYEYRAKKLAFETAIYKNGKIEFNYAPIGDYSTEYTLLSLSSDPINVWKLDESSGSTCDDAIDNKNLTYKTPSSMLPSTGQINTAAFFSGSSNTVVYADDPSFANYAVTNPFSFSAWFKSAVGDSSTKTIFSRMYYDYTKGYTFELAGGYLQLTMAQSYNSNALRVRSSTDPYNDGQWYHVVVTYDGTASSSGVKIYVNGQEVSTTATLTSLTTSSDIQAGSGGADFMIGGIGKYNNNNNIFTGSIDDVARWNAILTPGDVDLIYQNGLDSISSADIDPIGDSTSSYATCGIFVSGSGSWNYRDFAPLLGGTLFNRLQSTYGAALYTSSFSSTDPETSVTTYYDVNLDTINWPKHGGRIIFSPPKDKKKVNVKLDSKEKDKKQFFNSKPFDDRKSINFTDQDDVDAITCIPISHIVKSNYPGASLKQDLITDTSITLSSRRILQNNYVFLEDELENTEKIKPYSEEFQPEQISSFGNIDDFFLLGVSSPNYTTSTQDLKTLIKSKEVINLSFAVQKKTKMLSSASSIYYFDIASSQWIIPTGALVDHFTNPFNKLSAKTAQMGIGGDALGSYFLEDKIGFDAYGNCLSSGSLNVFRSTVSNNDRNHSLKELGKAFELNKHMSLLSTPYQKSIYRNSQYDGNSDQIFTLPINDPFLIEKAVIQLPFRFGPSWFNDRTTYLITSASNYAHTASGGAVTALSHYSFFDDGGPAITVSLFCQKNNKQNKVRELVFKSTFTHEDDVNKTIEFLPIKSGSSEHVWYAVITGNENNHNLMTSSVSYSANKTFTGSVSVQATPSVTNCAHISVFKTFNMTSYSNSGSMLIDFDQFLAQTSTSINDSVSASILLGVDPFGRSMGGFEAGEELNTTEGVLFGDSIANPFYTSGSVQRQTITGSLEAYFNSSTSGSYLHCISKVPLGKPKNSPYLIQPGDKLILAVSKTRPTYRLADIRLNDSSLTTGKISTVVSSSYFCNIQNSEGHEVYLDTGTINIKLYGSNIKNGKEI